MPYLFPVEIIGPGVSSWGSLSFFSPLQTLSLWWGYVVLYILPNSDCRSRPVNFLGKLIVNLMRGRVHKDRWVRVEAVPCEKDVQKITERQQCRELLSLYTCWFWASASFCFPCWSIISKQLLRLYHTIWAAALLTVEWNLLIDDSFMIFMPIIIIIIISYLSYWNNYIFFIMCNNRGT